MKKFKFLLTYGLKKRIARKSFIIANIVIAILFVAIVNLPTIIGWFSSGEDEISNINVNIYNQTEMTDLSDDLETVLNLPYEEDYYIFSEKTDTFNQDAFWEDSETQITLVVSGNVNQPIVDIYSKMPEYNQMIMGQTELIIINYQVPGYQSPTFNAIMAPDYENPEEEAALSSIMSLLVLPLFILITMATQFVGVDIIEEKSTKAIETIIASVPSKIHFLSKIAASISFVLIQGLLILIYGGIAALLGNASQTMGANMPADFDMHLLQYLSELMPNWPMVLSISLLFVIV